MLITKFLPSDLLDHTASMLSKGPDLMLRGASYPSNYVQTMFAFGRALIWRTHRADEVVQRLFALVRDPVTGTEAARSFELLFAPDEVVTRANGAVIRPLSKQQTFSICLPAIAQAVRQASQQSMEKANYLLALCGMLKHVDTSMLFPEMVTVAPLLLQILDLDVADAKEAAIRILMVVIHEDPAAFEGHAVSLITRLLGIAVNTEVNNVVCGVFYCLILRVSQVDLTCGDDRRRGRALWIFSGSSLRK